MIIPLLIGTALVIAVIVSVVMVLVRLTEIIFWVCHLPIAWAVVALALYGAFMLLPNTTPAAPLRIVQEPAPTPAPAPLGPPPYHCTLCVVPVEPKEK